MNSIDLLEAIGEIKGTYIFEAQQCREGPPRSKGHARLKILLIAAAVSILLAGCTYAYFKLQDMKVGEYIDPAGGERHDLIYSRDIPGSPGFLAVQEWLAFEESYDPDGQILRDSYKTSYIPPLNYYIYNCYTQEMQDKVDEICEKYGLKPAGRAYWGYEYDEIGLLFDDLGIRGIHREGAGIDTQLRAEGYFEDGSFSLSGTGILTDPEAGWEATVDYTYSYGKKGSFCPVLGSVGHIEDYQQWNYVTASGFPVLLALGQERAYVLADRGDAVIQVSILDPNFEDRRLPAQALEAFADTFDYSIHTEALPVPKDTYASILSDTYSVPSAHDLYLFWDLDGDGVEELLTGRDGCVDLILAMEGDTTKIVWAVGMAGGSGWMCPDGTFVDVTPGENGLTYRILRWEGSRFRFVDYLVLDSDAGGTWGRSLSLGDMPKVDTLISNEEAQEILKPYLPEHGQNVIPLDREWTPITDFPGAEFRGEPTDGPSYMASEEEQLTRRIIAILGSDPRYFEGSRIFYDGKVYAFRAIDTGSDYETCTPIGQLIYNETFPHEDKVTDFLGNDRCEVSHLEGGLIGDALLVNRGQVCSLLYVPQDTAYPREYEYRENDDGSITILKYRGSEANVFVPTEIDEKKVTAISSGPEGAFANCPTLVTVRIPQGVQVIGDNSFTGCYNPTEVHLPQSLEAIGHCAFQGCPQLKILSFDGDAPQVGNYILDTPGPNVVPDFTHIFYHENTKGWDSEAWENYDLVLY